MKSKRSVVGKRHRKKLTKSIVNNRIVERRIVMRGDYVNSHKKAQFQCDEGHSWMATPANVMQGTGCPHCAGNLPLNREIVNSRIAGRGLTMTGEYVNNSTKAEFQCGEGHVWKATPDGVMLGTGCPKCARREAGKKRRLTPEQIRQRLAGRKIFMIGRYKTANVKTMFQCGEGHNWKATSGSVLAGNGCPHCANRAPLTKEIVNERIHDRGLILIGDYKDTATRSVFQCSKGHSWQTTPGGVLGGSGCPHCDGQAPLNKDIVNDRIADRGFIMLGEYANVDTKSMFQCSEGHTWEATPYKVMARTGCPHCSRRVPLTTQSINDRISGRGFVMMDEFISSQTKVRFECSAGHIWEAKPNNILNGRGCPACSERACDNDIFYLWTAIDQRLVDLQPGEHLIKYGVTSERLKDQRVREVASSWGARPNVIAYVKTLATAVIAEKSAAGIGKPLTPEYSGLDGWTEFRIVDEAELSQLLLIAEESADYKIIWDDPVAGVNEFRLV